jgi:branched-chain amino acid transport system permease protein
MNNIDAKTSFTIMGFLLLIVGILQSWGVAFSILNLCLISAIMSMGVNIQWGFAGLINFGVMGFLAIGGLATVLISVPPVIESWSAGGLGILISLIFLIFIIYTCLFINKRFSNYKYKYQIIFLVSCIDNTSFEINFRTFY